MRIAEMGSSSGAEMLVRSLQNELHSPNSDRLPDEAHGLGTNLHCCRKKFNEGSKKMKIISFFPLTYTQNSIRSPKVIQDQQRSPDTTCSRLTPNSMIVKQLEQTSWKSSLINPKFRVNSKPKISNAEWPTSSAKFTTLTTMSFKSEKWLEGGIARSKRPHLMGSISTIISLILLSSAAIIGLQSTLIEGIYQQSTNAPMGQVVEGKLDNFSGSY